MDDAVAQALIEKQAELIVQIETLTHVVGFLLGWDAAREEHPEHRISLSQIFVQRLFEDQDLSAPYGQQRADGIRRVAEVLEYGIEVAGRPRQAS